MDSRIPLFAGPPPPREIKVVEKPLIDGGVPQSVALPEFLRRYNNTMRGWTETVHCDADVPRSQNNSVPPEELAHMLKHILSVREKLCLLNMGPFGYGVITLETLPPYTVIGFYAGDHCREETSNPYAFGAGAAHDALEVVVNAAERGNITRFIQHGPLK